MIKFFRKIRQKLLAEGKTTKYLKYAVGEIILVVIGILIALQINNWNELRKEDIQEQTILKRLRKEFTSNRNQLLKKMEIRNGVISACNRLLTYYNEPEQGKLDSIYSYLGSIVPTTFDPIQNDLVSSGNIEIIDSEELKQLLINWSTDVIQLMETEQMFMRYWGGLMANQINETGIQRNVAYSFYKKMAPNMLEKVEIRNPIHGKSKIGKVSKEELLTDPKLEGVIAWSMLYSTFCNLESKTLMKRIDYILEIVNSEIE